VAIGWPAKLSQKTKKVFDFEKPFKITSQTAKSTEKVAPSDLNDWRDVEITGKIRPFPVYLHVYR
jgi:hypothetical protein